MYQPVEQLLQCSQKEAGKVPSQGHNMLYRSHCISYTYNVPTCRTATTMFSERDWQSPQSRSPTSYNMLCYTVYSVYHKHTKYQPTDNGWEISYFARGSERDWQSPHQYVIPIHIQGINLNDGKYLILPKVRCPTHLKPRSKHCLVSNLSVLIVLLLKICIMLWYFR